MFPFETWTKNVYLIINLDGYLANPVPPQDVYFIENGLCPMLPSYHFGMTPFMFEPEISGPVKGKPKVEYEYEFVSLEPEDDDVFITINLGDGTSPDTIGPFASGEVAVASHKWSTKGSYEIKAKSNDIYGDESEWNYQGVSIPRTYMPLILRILNRFPNAFPILRHLMGLY